MTVYALDATGAKIPMSTTLDASGNAVGSTCVTDPQSGSKQSVNQFHNADHQTLSGGTLFSGMASGAIIVVDPISSLGDRLHSAGAEGAANTGIAAVGSTVVAEVSVNSGAGAVAGAPVAAVITPAAMSGTLRNPLGGPGWSIQVGTTILYDVGGANQEMVEVTAITATTFTANFAKNHSAGVPMLVFSYFQARQASGNVGVQAVNAEGFKATYRYCLLAQTLVATPTDAIVMQGSATKTIRIKRIKITGQATAQGSIPVQLVRRSTAGTIGSAVLVAITPAKHDPNDATGSTSISLVTVANYGALGTSSGVLAVDRLGMSPLSTGAAGQGQAVVWDFSTRNDKPLALRGVSDFLCINFNGAAIPAGGVFDFEIETEEDFA